MQCAVECDRCSTVCNYTLVYAHVNGIYQGWGVIATMNGIVYQPHGLSDHLAVLGGYQLILFGMGGLLLKLQNFKKVNLIFGHPVFESFFFFWFILAYIYANCFKHTDISHGGIQWVYPFEIHTQPCEMHMAQGIARECGIQFG